jgi:hypothetical protein
MGRKAEHAGCVVYSMKSQEYGDFMF